MKPLIQKSGWALSFAAGMFLPHQNAVGAAEASSRPNIIWIFSDDHAYQAIGAYGGRLQPLNPTPNIDRLASEGMRFDRCYVANSICAPSRATLLTGKFSHMNGKYDNRDEFDHNQEQFQKILQKNGYQTVMVGKIHLNGKMQGFDYWDVLPGQGEYNDPVFVSEEGKTKSTGYVTDIITDKSLDWLANKRDPQKPFMLMIHQKAPHRTWIPAEREMSRYEDIEIPEPTNLFDDYSTRTTAAHEQDMSIEKTMSLVNDLKVGGKYAVPGGQFAARNEWYAANKPEGKDLVKWKYQLYMKDYLRCVWSVDESVGRVLQALKDMGLDENTIVMYSSDQGFYLGEHGWFDKRFMYEQSFRTPLLARWPGKIKPGSVNTDLAQNVDFAETFLDLAGAPIPADMQGKSLVPLLKGKTPSDWRTSLYYHYYEYPGTHSVRRHEGVENSRYKLIRFYGKNVPNGEEWELYDLKNDPQEMNNLYNNPESAALVQDLKKELGHLKELYKVPEYPADTKALEGKASTGAAPAETESVLASGFTVLDGDLSKNEEGYRLAAGTGMGFALKPLPANFKEQRIVVFQAHIKTAESGSANGLICFGAGTDPEDLVKCGVYAGPGELVVLYGKFGGPEKDIIRQKAGLSRKQEYDITVTVNLDSQTVCLDVNGKTLSAPLRKPLPNIGFYGFNCNKTETRFSDITVSFAK
jgi:arylsulfatase A-like enzyme